MSSSEYSYDVLVVGGGPTGLVLANLLGLSGLRVAVLEKHASPYPLPRANHLDAETLRLLQLTGLMEALWPHTSPFGPVEARDHRGQAIFRESCPPPADLHGYPADRFFDQVAFEQALRAGLKRFPGQVELWAGYEAKALVMQERDVSAIIGNGLSFRTLRGKWLVGADGARSMVRTHLQIGMEVLAAPERWAMADVRLPDAHAGEGLPDSVCYHFGRERLALYAHGHGLLRRWEFQLAPDETPSEAEALAWIGAWADPGGMALLRLACYEHRSMVARRWRQGNVLLAGDAAHLMPPSAGQGLCAGVRDAANLAWKLAAVARGQAPESLLDTYEAERRPHLMGMMARSHFIGSSVQGATAWQRFRRKLLFGALRRLPALQKMLCQQQRRPLPLGKSALGHLPWAGRPLPQANRSDDALGYRWALLALPEWPAPLLRQEAFRKGIKPLGQSEFLMGWMRREGLQWALVRPDKTLFAAGNSEADCLRALGEMAQGPWGFPASARQEAASLTANI